QHLLRAADGVRPDGRERIGDVEDDKTHTGYSTPKRRGTQWGPTLNFFRRVCYGPVAADLRRRIAANPTLSASEGRAALSERAARLLQQTSARSESDALLPFGNRC